MSKTFAPILCPVKGNPDISIYFSDESCAEFNVFIGLALLEKVSAQKDRPEFKMLLGRLHNMKRSGRELARCFAVLTHNFVLASSRAKHAPDRC